MKITYTPYRGKIEPVKKVYKSDINLTDKFIEVTTYYDYEAWDSDKGIRKDDSYKSIKLIRKEDVSGLTIENYLHEGDPNDESCPRVIIDGTYTSIHIWLTEETVFDVYKTVKDWMLNEKGSS